MEFSFDEEKRSLTLRERGLDFSDAYKVFESSISNLSTTGLIMGKSVISLLAFSTVDQ